MIKSIIAALLIPVSAFAAANPSMFDSIIVNSLTPNTAMFAGTGGLLSSSPTTATELGYVHGVTSAIQTQLNGLQPAIANYTAPTHQFINSFTAGAFGAAQPDFSDISGSMPLTQLAAQAANTFVANGTGSSAVPTAISAATAVSLLPAFVGDTGTGGTAGIVPAPAAGSAEQGLVIGAGGTFVTPDTSKPNNAPFKYLTQVLSFPGNQKMMNVLMVQNAGNTYAVVGGGTTKTVSIYNVTDQAAPVLRGTITLAGTYGVCGSTASWPYVFVPASGGRTLTVLNISNPNIPTVTGSFSWAANTTSIYSCSYSNGLVFMAGQSRGLGILDVGNGIVGGTLTTPVLAFDEGALNGAGQICNPANSCKSFGVVVDPANSIVYSTDFSTATPWTYRQLKAYSYASSITSPTLLQNLTLPANTKPLGVTIDTARHTAYVSDSNQNLYDVVDITNVSTGGMSYLSSFAPSGGRIEQAEMVAIPSPTSNLVYSPGSSATLAGAIDVWDLSNRSSPFLVSTVLGPLVPDIFGGIALDPRGGYIYAAAYGNGTTGSALDVFSTVYETATIGAATIDSLTMPAFTTAGVLHNSSAGVISSSLVNLTTDVTGVLPAANGGAGTQTQEVPSGTVNNSNVTFTLAHTPSSSLAVRLYIDDLFQRQAVNYTISGTTITMSVAPTFGQTIDAVYNY